MPIRVTGLIAPLDVEDIIKKLMAIERRPLLHLVDRQDQLRAKRTAWFDVKARLSSLRERAQALIAEFGVPSIWTKMSVTSSNTSVVTATAGENAVFGTYEVRVRQLATPSISRSGELNTKAAKVSSIEVVAGSGTIDVSKAFSEAGFENTPTGAITIGVRDEAGNLVSTDTFWISDYSTVQEFLDAINASTNAGVYIWYNKETDKFTITAKRVGYSIHLVEAPETEGTGFFTEVNIETGTWSAETGDKAGIDPEAPLYKSAFDTAVAEGSSGSFKINAAKISWSATDSLNDLLRRINTSEAEVTAFYDESLDKIMLTAKNPGDNPIVVGDVEGELAANVIKLPSLTPEASRGKNALLTINSTSIEDEIEKSSNKFTINNITFELRGRSEGIDESATNPYEKAEATVVRVKRDVEEVKETIRSFVSEFNRTMSVIEEYMAVEPETGQAAELAGEYILQTVSMGLLSKVTSPQKGLDPSMDELSDIGISTGTYQEGQATRLRIDESKLEQALLEDPYKVQQLFAASTDGDIILDTGVAYNISKYLEPFTAFRGAIQERINYTNEAIKRIDERIEAFEERLEQEEERIRKKFILLEQMMATFQATAMVLGGGGTLTMPRTPTRRRE